MASGARKIVVEFLGTTKSLDSALDRTGRKTRTFGENLRRAGRMAALGLAAGALIAGKALFEMTKAAVADEAAQVKLANTLKKAAGATNAQIAGVEEWITKQGELYGVTDDELRPALSKLAVATGSTAEAMNMVRLAMDIAAGSGKSLDQVTTALQKAQNGSVGGLSRLGVATKNAAGETKSFEQIQKELAATYEGAAAKGADTLEGKMNRLKVQLSEAGEAIGAKLIPVVSQMVDWFVNKGLPAIQQFGGWLRDNLGPIFTRIGEVLRSVFSGMDADSNKNLTAIKSTVMDFVSIVRSLWNRFGADIMEYSRKAFANIKQIIGGGLQVIAGIFKTVSALLKGDWSGAWEGIKQILRGAKDVIVGLVKQLANLVTTVLKVGWSALKAVAAAAWDGVKAAFRAGGQAVIEYVKGIPDRIKSQFSNAGSLLKAIGGQIIDGLKAGIQAAAYKVLDAVQSIINKIPKKIRDLMGISSPSKVTDYLGRMIGEGLARGIDSTSGKVSKATQKLIDNLKAKLSTVKDLFKGLKESVAGSFTSGMFDAETASDFVASLSSTKGTLGALKEAFKTLTGWGLKPGFLAQLFQSGNAGLILDLAKNKASAVEAGSLFGGITTASSELGGMVAGNQYGDEIKSLQDKIKDLEGKGPQGAAPKIDITVNAGVGDPVEIGRQIVKAIRQLERATGRQVLVTAG